MVIQQVLSTFFQGDCVGLDSDDKLAKRESEQCIRLGYYIQQYVFLQQRYNKLQQLTISLNP